MMIEKQSLKLPTKSKRKDDTFFSIEDARAAIQQKKENLQATNDEQILVQKKDILAQQSSTTTQQKVGAASIADILGFNPSAKKQTAPRDKDPEEIPTKYRKYYKLLLKLRDDVKHGLSKLTNENLTINVGRNKTDAVDADIESFNSEFAISLMANEQEALTEIEEAIQRIYNGTYGICELTGKPIEAKRLTAVPFARYSIEGQMEKEKIRPTETSRGSIFQADQSDDDLSDFETEDDE